MLREAYRRNHVARNSAYIILSTALTGMLGLAFWAVAARWFPTPTIGTSSALIASIAFASMFATMGLGTTALQVLPGASDELWSSTVNALVMAGSVFGMVAGTVLAVVLPHVSVEFAHADTPSVVVCLIAGTALMTLTALLDCIFQAERESQYIAIRGCTFGSLKLALLSLPLVFASRSLSWILVSWVVAAAVTCGITLGWQVRLLGRRHHYRVSGVRSWFTGRVRVLVLHHTTTLGGYLIPSLMPTLVVARLSSEANAHFYVAWLLSSILFTVSGAVAGSLLADLSHDAALLGERVRSAVRLVVILLGPSILLTVVLGRPVLAVFGQAYADHSYSILVIFAIVAIPDAVTNIYVTILRVHHTPGIAAAMNVGMAIVALAGAWILMPSVGASGAAWAWGLAQVLGCGFVGVHAYCKTHGGFADRS